MTPISCISTEAVVLEGAIIVNFEHVLHVVLVFLLLSLCG